MQSVNSETNHITADALRSALAEYLECSQALFACPSVERLRSAWTCFERLEPAHNDFRSVQLILLGVLIDRLEGWAA